MTTDTSDASSSAPAHQGSCNTTLHEHYVQRRPVAYSLTRLNIAEANYFRNRKAAIHALARHLEAQEELIRQNQ